MKRILSVTIGLLATALLTGCPGKSGSNTVPPNNNWGCVNCGFQNSIGAQFGSAISSQVPQGTLVLNLTGDMQQLNFWTSQGQNPIFTYQGQVGATATFQVSQEFLMGACRVAPGTYQMQLIQPGTYNMGVFQFPYAQLIGPTPLTIAFGEGVILTDGLGNIRGFSGLMMAQSGSPAFPNFNYNPQMQSQIPCGDSVGLRF